LLTNLLSAATISSDTILAAIKEAQVNIAEREKNIVTLTEPLEEAQRANADSEFAQLKGDILSEATTILVEKLGSSVLDVLGDIDVDAIMEQSGAARKKREVHGCVKDFDCNSKESPCPSSNEYRTVTGKCNNVKNITHGAAVTPVRRLLKKASYSDGFTKIRTQGVKGTPLPSTREISNKLHREGAKPGFDYRKNHFFMQFGQWVAHDIIFMPSSVGPNSKALDCTSCDSPKTSENCAPIPVPADDDYFKAFSNGTKRCIRLTRALNAQKGLGVRTQINQNTHFLDLSSVYGSEGCEAAAVRSFSNGELKTFIHNGEVLPPQNKNDSNCQSKAPEYCFVAGDFRNSLHPGLIPMHATYIKEHNRLAALFRNANPGWSDEQIFQVIRKAASFGDLKAEMEDVSVEALKKVYADVNDIDLYTGIMLERPMPGASIGPTGGFIIAEQFSALKRGDRFYYENQVPATRGLTPEQLDAIRRTHLAKVLCGNTPSMVKVNVNAPAQLVYKSIAGHPIESLAAQFLSWK
uniref:Chorion peroxidase (inferred by orthology to a D. melanogaster protein) n=1 Tax=Nippostrongylus brasiliensis TaxID=27835 RepID=A0A0N4YB88_NIPBR